MDLASYNRRGQLFSAANVSAKSHIAVTTAMTGLILYNPIGSGKYFLIADFGFVWTTAPAAVHNIGLAMRFAGAAPTSLTNIGSGVLSADGRGNRGASEAQCYDAATLDVAPVVQRWCGGAAYGSGVGESPYMLLDKIDGAIILAPGAILCSTVVTTTAVGMAHVTWAEVDV